MTIEERIARLETRADATEKWLSSIDQKVDQLVAAANMGKGAWWLMLRIGGALVVLGGVVGWLVNLLMGRHP